MGRSHVFEAALALPEPERLELAAELLASASTASGVLELDAPEYAAELRQRIASVRSGETKPIPLSDALERIQARARR